MEALTNTISLRVLERSSQLLVFLSYFTPDTFCGAFSLSLTTAAFDHRRIKRFVARAGKRQPQLQEINTTL